MRWWTGNGTDRPLYGREIDRCHPLAQGLVAAWLFNECGGSLVTDYVSMRQSNPLPAGLSLNGLGLNGNGQANAQVVLPYSLNLIDGGGPYSVMAVASWTSTTKQLIYTEDKAGVIGNTLQIVVNNTSIGDINVYCAPSGTYTGGAITSEGSWNDGKTHSIISTNLGSNNVMSLYIDGNFINNSIQPSGIYNTNRDTLGGFAGNNLWAFDGNISMILIWNRCLLEQEVSVIASFPLLLLNAFYDGIYFSSIINILGSSRKNDFLGLIQLSI